jgi:hypothetical protein
MVYEIRRPRDYFFGQLSAEATISDVTLTSPTFAALPTDYTTAVYMPLVLSNDTLGVREVVWVTGHAASSSNITVVRGREGTTAVAWGSSSAFRCTPTTRDTVGYYTRAGLPTDAHYGMRALVADEASRLVEFTGSGWKGISRLLNTATRVSDVVGSTETVLETITRVFAQNVTYSLRWHGTYSLAAAPPAFPTLRMRYQSGGTLTTASGTAFWDNTIDGSTNSRPLSIDGQFTVPTTGTYTVGLTAQSANNVTLAGNGRRLELWDTGS